MALAGQVESKTLLARLAGNWATDLEGGSRFGYTLLIVILLSNFMAMYLQALSLKLGVVGERDLAQACRFSSPPPQALHVLSFRCRSASPLAGTSVVTCHIEREYTICATLHGLLARAVLPSAFHSDNCRAVMPTRLLDCLFGQLSCTHGCQQARLLKGGWLACRDAYPKWVCRGLWVVAEIAIAATDMAEVIGSATALYLLFGIPIWAGVLITAVDVLVILVLGMRNFRLLEFVVFVLVLLILGIFIYQLAAANPNWVDVAKGFIPRPRIVSGGLLSPCVRSGVHAAASFSAFSCNCI